ncbi:MAG: hypothetical protein WA063_05420 [Minisyncoccia bacterium]
MKKLSDEEIGYALGIIDSLGTEESEKVQKLVDKIDPEIYTWLMKIGLLTRQTIEFGSRIEYRVTLSEEGARIASAIKHNGNISERIKEMKKLQIDG